MRFRAVVAAGSVLVTMATSIRVDACDCSEPPFRNEFQVGQGVVPRNAPGVPWWFTRGDGVSDLREVLTLEQLGDGGAREVEVRVTEIGWGSYVAGPAEGWLVGERYRVSSDLGGAVSGPSDLQVAAAEFEIAGDLNASLSLALQFEPMFVGEIPMQSSEGSCTQTAKASYVDLALELPELGEVLSDQLHFETFVDGRRWSPQESLCSEVQPGRSWQGAARDRVFALCEVGDEGVSLGVHELRMDARLPGSDVVFASDEVPFEFRCDEQVVDGGVQVDAGQLAGEPDGGPMSRNITDAGSESVQDAKPPAEHEAPTVSDDAETEDAGVEGRRQDAAAVAAADVGDSEKRKDSGCSVVAGGSSTTAPLAGLLLLLAVRRRRRRAQRTRAAS